MLIRKVSAGRGAAWINESIASLKNAGTGFWLTAFIIGLLGSIPYLGAIQGALILFFYGSLVLCLNNPNQQNNIFSGLQNGNFNRILPILMLYIFFFALIVIALWPLVLASYDMWQNGQTQMDPAQAELLIGKTFIHFTWLLPIGIYLSWMTQFAIPLATIGGLSGKDSIILGSKAVFTNLGAIFINALCFVLVMFIVMFVCMIPTLILGVVFASNETLIMLAFIPISALMMTMYLSLMSANMLHAYRDIFGAAEAATTKDTEFLM